MFNSFSILLIFRSGISSKLKGTGGGSCEGAESTINLAENGEKTIRVNINTDCIFYVFNNFPGKITMTVTGASVSKMISNRSTQMSIKMIYRQDP